jgi:hypothetical protein
VPKLVVPALLLCTNITARSQQPIPHFVDITSLAGLSVPHISSADKKYIIESVSGGVGFSTAAAFGLESSLKG